MDVNEHPSSGAVIRTNAVSLASQVMLCIETDEGALHVFTLDTARTVSLIGQLEAAYCRQFLLSIGGRNSSRSPPSD
ncbi:hypothetical protein [Solimonas marina]|uniref:Uncharacterized protein n=1 Tax=Solimonas marina TaxID=2714601 RepID=A0A970B6J4_9GAMM|nr:hypothetical protein [Solimonas marina]NKF24547.1 hypothetical protein [Solimonas marina]